MKKTLARLTAAIVLATGAALPMSTTAHAVTAPVKYANCTALNKVYPHGVKKATTTKDRYVSGGRTLTRISAAKVNLALYNANTARDGDKDGIACEK